ncbi:PD-(D/E)XK nuclease family protein [Ghiorsea bivora]|uniref:PD-(D/E)XK nuclease family protein n=1 Tax=Ghiorsea bivora TaxID=1485545 RepID=UPI0005706CDD|nr:PD-(D/E)XK nuclease family protein [Ghiorsea bivora]
MQIVFDMAYDQATAPNGVQAGQSSLGKLMVGSQGLLGVLETHLGLTSRETHHAMRIQGYMESMQAVVDKPEASFFKRSLEADAWSSAKQFIDYRDELVLAGWDGCDLATQSAKLHALALVESVFPETLKKGLGDKLQSVLMALDHNPSLHIQTIELTEPLDALPFLIGQVLRKLQALGVCIDVKNEKVNLANGNLGMIQNVMFDADHETAPAKQGDDSIVLLCPEDEWTAANTLASWLKADEAKNTDVLLVQNGGSDVLDHALNEVALPMLGNSTRSAFRAALQIMPLALSNAWSPLNIQALLSFLSLKVSPVPSFAAKRLLGAIQNEPGVGGERWQKAENKIIEIKKDRLLADGIEEADAVIQAQTFMDELNHYLTGFRFDPQSGIPAKAVVEMCDWIKQGLKTPELKQSMAQALAQVDRMIELASCYNQPIPRAQIERMLDSVIAEGGQNPDSQAQATPWHSVSDTGSIAGKVGTVVWWNFTDSGQSSLAFWSEEERESLQKTGVHLETPATIRAREANQWRRALQYAGERLLLISPLKMNGEATQLHPLWDEIRHCAVSPTDSEAEKEDKYQRLLWQGKSLNAEPTLSLAGRSIVLQAENKAALQAPEEVIQVGKGIISKPKGLSFSQMSTLLGCPTKWAFQYHAGLRSMDSLSLPTGNTMIGSLCHKIVEDIYTDTSKWDVGSVRNYVSKLFDLRVPQMAAELLEPGRELELERYRISVCDAVEALLQTIDKAGLKVTQTEGMVSGKDLDGIPFKGYIDLLLEDDDGQTFVIDLKWTGSTKYKTEEIKEGNALQLASYAWMLKSADDVWAPGAYFMLAQGELLTDDYRFNTDRIIESPLSAKEVWQLGSKTWRSMFQEMQNGEIEVSGLMDEGELKEARNDAGIMHVKPPCHFCDFGKLCGQTRAEA